MVKKENIYFSYFNKSSSNQLVTFYSVRFELVVGGKLFSKTPSQDLQVFVLQSIQFWAGRSVCEKLGKAASWALQSTIGVWGYAPRYVMDIYASRTHLVASEPHCKEGIQVVGMSKGSSHCMGCSFFLIKKLCMLMVNNKNGFCKASSYLEYNFVFHNLILKASLLDKTTPLLIYKGREW